MYCTALKKGYGTIPYGARKDAKGTGHATFLPGSAGARHFSPQTLTRPSPHMRFAWEGAGKAPMSPCRRWSFGFRRIGFTPVIKDKEGHFGSGRHNAPNKIHGFAMHSSIRLAISPCQCASAPAIRTLPVGSPLREIALPPEIASANKSSGSPLLTNAVICRALAGR